MFFCFSIRSVGRGGSVPLVDVHLDALETVKKLQQERVDLISRIEMLEREGKQRFSWFN